MFLIQNARRSTAYCKNVLISLLMLFIVLYRPRGVLPEEKVVSLTRD